MAPAIPFGENTKSDIYSSLALLRPIFPHLQDPDKSQSLQLDIGAPEAGYVISVQGSSALVSLSYSLDNDSEAANGRLVLKDSFRVDLQNKKLLDFQRVIEGGGQAPFWNEAKSRLAQSRKFSTTDREVKEFFRQVVLKLPIPAPEEPAPPETRAQEKETRLNRISLETALPANGMSRFTRLNPLPHFSDKSVVTQKGNLLNRRSLFQTGPSILNSTQFLLDRQSQGFISGATSPQMLGALFCGSVGFQVGRALGAGIIFESLGATRLFSTAMGLLFEVPSFELASRSLDAFQKGKFEWEGLGTSMMRGYFTFGAFRGVGSISHSPLVSFSALHGINELERFAGLRNKPGHYMDRLFEDTVFFAQLSFASEISQNIFGNSLGLRPGLSEQFYKTKIQALDQAKKYQPIPEIAEVREERAEPPITREIIVFNPIAERNEIQLGDVPDLSVASSISRMRNVGANLLHGPFAFLTTQGIGYGANADAVAVKVLPEGHLAFLNADGAGYSGDPALAARYIVEALQSFKQVGDMPKILLDANGNIYAANQQGALKANPAYGVALGATIESPKFVGDPHLLHLNWAGDARAMVLERDTHGDWQWHYSSVEENMPNAVARSPDARKVILPNLNSSNFTQELVLHPKSNIITNQLGMYDTSVIKSTAEIEVPDSSHDLGRRPAPEFAQGIPLKKGALLILGSDGLWENFLRTRYFLDLIKDCHTPEEVLKVATQEVHHRMEIVDRIKHPKNYREALVESTTEGRFVFIKNGKQIFVDKNGRVYESADVNAPVIDHYKQDNFSMMVYLHEPLETTKGAIAEGKTAEDIEFSGRDTDPSIQLPASVGLTPPPQRPAVIVPEVKLGDNGLPIPTPPPPPRITPPPASPQTRTTPLPPAPALTPPPRRVVARRPSPLAPMPPPPAPFSIQESEPVDPNTLAIQLPQGAIGFARRRLTPPPPPPALTPPPRRSSSSSPPASTAGTYPPFNPPPRIPGKSAPQRGVEIIPVEEDVVFSLLRKTAARAFQPKVPLPSEVRIARFRERVSAKADLIEALEAKIGRPVPPPRSKSPTRPYPIATAGAQVGVAVRSKEHRRIPSLGQQPVSAQPDVRARPRLRKIKEEAAAKRSQLPEGIIPRPSIVLDFSTLDGQAAAPAKKSGKGADQTVVGASLDLHNTVVMPQNDLQAGTARKGPPPLPPQTNKSVGVRPASDLRATQPGDSRALAKTVIDEGVSLPKFEAEGPDGDQYKDVFDGMLLDLNPDPKPDLQ